MPFGHRVMLFLHNVMEVEKTCRWIRYLRAFSDCAGAAARIVAAREKDLLRECARTRTNAHERARRLRRLRVRRCRVCAERFS
jgi:hypothetical protein